MGMNRLDVSRDSLLLLIVMVDLQLNFTIK